MSRLCQSKYALCALGVILGALLTFSSSVFCTTILVPADQPTIQAGITAAFSGDTVLVASGTYSGSGNRDISFSGKSVILLSESGPEATVIDCEGSASEPHRAFEFQSVGENGVIIDGFTITGGYFTGWGGAIYFDDASPTIINCVLSGNVSETDGGALYIRDNAGPAIIDCTVKDNSAARGGGLYAFKGEASFTNCLFVNNSAATYGGGVNLAAPSSADSLVSVFTNCTFVGNEAQVLGGHIYTYNTSPDFNNCIMAFSREGGGVTCGSISYSPAVLACCNVYGNIGGDYSGCISDQTGINGNFSADPKFCDTATGDFHLLADSPCHPDSTACGLIGALAVGCIGEILPVALNINYGPTADGNVVVTPTPEIFWSYYDTAATTQTQYEIEVGTDDDWTVAEMWDTGPVLSSDTNTVYTGLPVSDHVLYFLRIRLHNGTQWGSWQKATFIPRLTTVLHVPSQYQNIQAGIDAAVGGDTILVVSGVYTGDGNRDIDFHGKSIVVMSEGGPLVTTIDCQGSETDKHRGFYFHLDEDSSSILDGFTITGGFAPPENSVYQLPAGGGMYCLNSAPTIRNCIFENNKANEPGDPRSSYGGGLYCDNASPTLITCTFYNNYANNGGGIHCDESCSLTVTGCTFLENGNDGMSGRLFNRHELTDCTFQDNINMGLRLNNVSSASLTGCNFIGNGGGFYIATGSGESNTIINCTFRNHGANGAWIVDADAVLDSCIFDNNGGTGIGLVQGSNVTFTNCVLSNNLNSGATVRIGAYGQFTRCTFVDNYSENNGSGLEVSQASASLSDCIVAFNLEGPAVDCTPGEVSLSCCDVYGNAGGDYVGCLAGQGGINNNFSLDPLFCSVANNDYHLLEGSPCTPENSPCGNLVGAFGTGCSSGYPIAININYGPEADSNVVPTATPEIFWSYFDVDSTTQSGYQIQVGTDNDWTVAEMWDSGPVVSSDTGALYAGTALADHALYYLRIKVENGVNWGDWKESSFIPRLSTRVQVPTQQPDIQTAVDWTVNSDTILVTPGTYTGTGNRDIDFAGKSIVLLSQGGPEITTIDCGGTAGDPHRGFSLHSGEDSTTVIEGFTIRGGYDDQNGGALWCDGASFTLKNCIFTDNYAGSSGGALSLFLCQIKIQNCTFMGNTTDETMIINNGVIALEVEVELLMDNTIIAFNDAAAISCNFADPPAITCSDLYGNTQGDWVECIAGYDSIGGNFSSDPLFCDTSSGWYAVDSSSQCAPYNNSCGVLVGAGSVGCISCCENRGNADGDPGDAINVADLTYLVEYLFFGGPAPPCPEEGDVDGSGAINVVDLTYLVDYLFFNGPPPVDCP